MNWGRIMKKEELSNDLPAELVEWHEISADRNQRRTACGSYMPSATKETPASPRQNIWAELRYGTVLA
jgi:hypothetical protein